MISKARKLEIEDEQIANQYRSKINGFLNNKQLEIILQNEKDVNNA